MKVLLVSPPSDSPIKSTLGAGGVPLGLAYLASAVRKEYNVKIVDAFALDLDQEELEAEIRSFNPDVVGVTATTPTIYDAYEVAKTAKEVNPNCRTIIGGPHVTFTAEETLQECPFLDIVVRGEGERTISELMRSLDKDRPLEEVKGITFRRGGGIKQTEDRSLVKDMDELPFPAYDLLEMDNYEVDGEKFGMTMTSRGCPFNCVFCSSSQLFGKLWRGRSPEKVVEELKMLSEDYGVREIAFMDDTFTLNNRRAQRICEGIMEEGLDISWACSSRVDTITERLAKKLKKAGCHTLYLGLESGSQRILDALKKGINVIQSEKVVEMVKDVGINTLASFILGVPGETVRTMNKTIDFAKKLAPSMVQFTICTPYPGTELFSWAEEGGHLMTKDWSKYTTLDPVMNIPGVAAEKIRQLMWKAYFYFYLRPSYFLRQVKEKNLFLVKAALKGAFNYLSR